MSGQAALAVTPTQGVSNYIFSSSSTGRFLHVRRTFSLSCTSPPLRWLDHKSLARCTPNSPTGPPQIVARQTNDSTLTAPKECSRNGIVASSATISVSACYRLGGHWGSRRRSILRFLTPPRFDTTSPAACRSSAIASMLPRGLLGPISARRTTGFVYATPLCRARAGAGVSLPLHPPRRHLQSRPHSYRYRRPLPATMAHGLFAAPARELPRNHPKIVPTPLRFQPLRM